MLRKLYDWVIHWAKTPHAQVALFLIAFAESSFFPVPPDVLLVAMVIAHEKKWLRYVGICLAGSVLGGLAGYAIGWGMWQAVSDWFFAHVFSEAAFGKVQQLYQEHNFWAVFVAGFTPIPYKVFTIAGGVAQINIVIFVIASFLSRGLRFFIVAFLLYRFGPKMRELLDRYFNILSLIFVILLIGGFVLLKGIGH